MGVAVAVWRVGWNSGFQLGLAAAITGSLLVVPHIFIQDFALMLPAAMVIYGASTGRLTRFIALVLLTPVLYLFELAAPWPAGAVLPAALLLLLAAMSWEFRAKPLLSE